MDICSKIDGINWLEFETAYGNAEKIPSYLRDLFSYDKVATMKATHLLWCSLCHQHAFVSTAALPAYDFLLIGLLELYEEIKVELLDIFLGFAICTENATPHNWEFALRKKLLDSVQVFKALSTNNNELISYFANEIIASLC